MHFSVQEHNDLGQGLHVLKTQHTDNPQFHFIFDDIMEISIFKGAFLFTYRYLYFICVIFLWVIFFFSSNWQNKLEWLNNHLCLLLITGFILSWDSSGFLNLNVYGKFQCGTLHLVLVVFLKLFILGHSEMVLPVTNLPCRSITISSILSILLPEDKDLT